MLPTPPPAGSTRPAGAIMAAMLHAPRDDGPEPQEGPDRPGRSGKAFVISSVIGVLALGAILALLGPRLQEATEAMAPDPPPTPIADGRLGDRAWSATATEPEEETPCLRLDADGEEVAEACGAEQGPSALRALGSAELDGDLVLLAIGDARTTEVEVVHGGGSARLEGGYADYGFPMGFAAGPVEQPVEAVRALSEDGEVRGWADCTRGLDDHDPDADELPPFVLGPDEELADGQGCLLIE